MGLNPVQATNLEFLGLVAVIAAPIAAFFAYARWQERRATRAQERRMAEKFATEQHWAELIKYGRNLEVPPIVMWIYHTPQEYIQDLAQMKALGFEIENELVYGDGSREVTYSFGPGYRSGTGELA